MCPMSLLTNPAVWSIHGGRAKIVVQQIKKERDTLELRLEPYFQVYFSTKYLKNIFGSILDLIIYEY